MTHPILAKIDDLDVAVGNSADLTAQEADYLRVRLRAVRADAAEILYKPAPGSTTQVHGATITHRSDLINERARQAAAQGDADPVGRPC